MSKIGVFPASGGLGSSITRHLLKLKVVKPSEIVLICRYPEKLPREFTSGGAIARRADYHEPESLTSAFNDISCLFLVSYPSIQHEHRFNAHARAIDAALQSTPGVKHIFYSSLAFTAPDHHSAAHVMQAHLSTEHYLSELAKSPKPGQKAFSYTIVREGIYSETWPMYTGFPDMASGHPRAAIPGSFDGPGVAFIKRDELGEASALLLQGWVDSKLQGELKNQTILLSGPEVWTLSEVLRGAGKIAAKDVEMREVSVDEYVQLPAVTSRLASHGPGEVPRQWATTYESLAKGETARTSGWVERLINRKPESFLATLAGTIKQM